MYGKLFNMAQNAASQIGSENKENNNPDDSKNNNKNHQQQQQQPSTKSFVDVGAEVKKTLADAQARQARGEGVDYAKLGALGKNLAEIYNASEKKDAQQIGKDIFSGFVKGNDQPKPETKADGDTKPEKLPSVEQQQVSQPEGKKQPLGEQNQQNQQLHSAREGC